MNGFVGEFLILLGGFTASRPAGVLASTGIIIGAGYMLWLYQRVFFMETSQKMAGLMDVDFREIITLVPMVVFIFWIGIYPDTFLSFMHASVQHLLERFQQPAGQEIAKGVVETVKIIP
jgi:NADH-quinone oxidoreductase subunit M